MLVTPNTLQVSKSPTALPLRKDASGLGGELAGGETNLITRGGEGGPHVSPHLPNRPGSEAITKLQARGPDPRRPPHSPRPGSDPPAEGLLKDCGAHFPAGPGRAAPRCSGASRGRPERGRAGVRRPCLPAQRVPPARDSEAPGPGSPTRGDRRARRGRAEEASAAGPPPRPCPEGPGRAAEGAARGDGGPKPG